MKKISNIKFKKKNFFDSREMRIRRRYLKSDFNNTKDLNKNCFNKL